MAEKAIDRAGLAQLPALWISPPNRFDLILQGQVIEAGEDDLQDPGTGGGVEVLLADDPGDDFKGGSLASGKRLAHLAEQLLDLAPRLGDLRLGIAKWAAVAGQAE